MNRRRVRFVLLGCDLAWIVIALSLAILSRFLQGRMLPGELPNFVPVFAVSLAAWPVLFAWLRLDGFRWGAGVSAVTANVLVAVTSLLVVISSVQFGLRRPVPRGTLALLGFLLVAGCILTRRCVLATLKRGHRLGASQKVLIVGNGPLSQEVNLKIADHPEFLYEIAGYLHSDLDSDFAESLKGGGTVSAGGLKKLLQEHDISEVFVVERRMPPQEMNRFFEVCTELGIGLSFIPQTYEMYVFRPEMMDIGGLPFIRLRPVALSFAARVSKRCMDVSLSLILIAIQLPVLAFLTLYAHLTTGKVLCREPRIGLDGKPFSMLRFSVDSGSTATALAELCHRWSLTELPQFFNVLCGEMSLVGPRPEGPDRVKHYSDWQRLRLRVAPGITGLAQVQGIRTSNSSESKTKFDLQYIQSWSPLLDISLILQTLSTIVFRGSRPEPKPSATVQLSEVNPQC
jgi:lipopolysaccharide/colanic/teichoic acid biosynthesis glycosyltransferase